MQKGLQAGSHPAIEIHGLTKVYARRRQPPIVAVDHLDLIIPQGQIFGLLGSNGAGKTTTIKMLCSLIQPTAGQIFILGDDTVRRRSAALSHIGAVLEGTRNIYWRLTPWQNLLYFGRMKGCTTREITLRAEELLRSLQLWEWRHESVSHFSRGMQQKVAIACALIADPPIVLLDEPTLGLDYQATQTMKEWIIRLTEEYKKTVVLTTHQLDIAQELCVQIAIMRQGRLLTNLPLTELLNMWRNENYRVAVKGHLESDTVAIPAGMQLTYTIVHNEVQSVLQGPLTDQETLHRLLAQLQVAGYPLIAMNRVEPTLEDVFVQSIEDHAYASTTQQQEEQQECTA